MSKPIAPHTPNYRLHKASGQGFVEFHGRRIYLGKFGLPETERKYHQTLAEWLANGRNLSTDPSDVTVTEVIARFWDFAKGYYRTPEGKPSSSLVNFKSTLRELKRLYGPTKAAEFGPRSMKTMRDCFVRAGHCRKHVNQLVSRVKHVFRWAVSEELVSATVIHALDSVAGLKRGRSDAPESLPVRPAPESDIRSVEPHLNRQIWAMVQLQILTGVRPGEVTIMRPVDVDTKGPIWFFRPITHKTAYRDRPRTVYLGPKAQEIVKPFLQNRAVVDFLFSPMEAEKERRESLHALRKTPHSCGNVPGSNRSDTPERKPGKHYTNNTYRRAIERACVAAGVDVWTPGQLRHNAATNVRRQFGLEAAQLVLGHAKADVTQVYAEVNELKAMDVAQKIG